MSMIKITSRIVQAGISIVELMVGIAVGLMVIAGVVAIYAVIARSGTEILGSARLNEELRAAMNLMASDIRRAGSYRGGSATNPFTSPGVTDIKILDSGSCILFAYDATFRSDTSLGVVDKKDFFGYKLLNGAIYARKTNSDNSGVTNCSGSGSDWERLTDEQSVVINVDSLKFSTKGSGCINTTKASSSPPPTNSYWQVIADDSTLPACDPATPNYVAPSTNDRLLEKRQIMIGLEGKLKNRQEFSMVLEQSVFLANDRVFIVP